MNHSDYIESSHLQPVPGPEIKPDRQEPGPVPSQEQAEQLIQELFGRKLAAGAFMTYHKDLHKALNHSLQATLGKKRAPVEMAILLYAIIHWHLPGKDGASKLRVQKDGYYWIARKQSEWADDLAVTSRSIQNYLDDLVSLNLIEYRSGAFSAEKTTLVRLLRPGLAEMIENYVSQTGKVFALYQPDTNGKVFVMGDDTKRKLFVIDPAKSENFSQSNTQISNTQTSNTHKHRAGGGEVDFEILEREPREAKPDQGTGQAQAIHIETESTSLSSKKDQAGTTADRGSENYSSVPPSRFAPRQSHNETTQARILARAEQKFGEVLGTKNKFLGTDPAILDLAFAETEVAVRTNQIKASEMGYFITRIRHWLANPEEFQAHPDIRGRNRALASIAEFHELFGWETEQTSPDWPGAGGPVADLDLGGAKRYLDWLIGRARGLVRDENLRIGEDPRDLSLRFTQTRYDPLPFIVDAECYRNYLAWAATQPDCDSPEHMALIEERKLAREAALAQMRAARESIHAAQASRTPVATQRVEV